MGKRKSPQARSRNASARVADIPAPPGENQEPAGARALVAPLVAFVGLLALYVATLAPSVMGGDSGELTTAALSGGVPHPPGYPLFAMLARLFAALPLGHSPAWRVNLLSAVSTATAAGLLCALVQSWTRNKVAGLMAAALFGTNTNVWLHATSAEVFGLNVMFVALAFHLWLRVERDPRQRRVFALALACGLAMCNHHTFVFVGAPLVLRTFWVARRELKLGGIAIAIGLGLVGLLPYGYLVHASRSSAAVSWGDLDTWDALVGHVLRRNYGTFSMGQTTKGSAFVSEGTFFPTLWHMAGHAFPRFLWLGPVLALVGFHAGIKNRQERSETHVLAFVLALYGLSFCMLSNLSTSVGLYLTVLERFFIQSDFMIAIAAGLGVAKLAPWLHAHWPRLERVRFAGYASAAIILLAGVVAHGREANQSGNRVFPDFVTTAFASLPRNAMVITMGDHLTGAVFYFREIEKLRPDVIHLDHELLGFPWYGQRKRRLYPDLYLPEGVYGRGGWGIKKLLDGNPTHPLVVIDRLDTWDQSWKDGYKLATNGLVHPLVPASQFPTFDEWRARDVRAMGNYDVMPALRASEKTWEYALGQMVLSTQGGRAHLALVYSTDNGNAPAPARMALDLLEDLIAKAGGDDDLGIAARPGSRSLFLSANVWKDLGIASEILSRVDPAHTPRIAIAFEKFVERAAPDDPDLPKARAYVEAHRAARKRQ
jgi:hypothetical protein